MCLRPEALRVVPPGAAAPPGSALIEATVTRTEFTGALTRIEAKLVDGTPLKVALLDQSPAATAPGRRIALAYEPGRVTVFRRGEP